jgi:predicted MFS family arabinose efflux permease
MTQAGRFGNAYTNYALGVLTAVYTLNLVDRSLMTLLLQPIKEDMQLSDTQLGLLTGIAFGLFYATVGLPIARWSDRGNRVSIAATSIGLWGITVMASLVISSFTQMVIARIAAAVGESGCKPPTYSLVGDYFPDPGKRTRAMAIYLAGSPLSALLAYIFGGWLNEHFGWRLTFCLAGILGLLLALVVKLTLVEPRTLLPPRLVDTAALPSLKEVAATLWHQRPLRHLCSALIVLYTLSLGLSPWYAAFMMRSHAMGTAELGIWFGLIVGIGGVAGVLAGGFAASRWFGGNDASQMRMSAATMVVLLPCYVAFLTFSTKHGALVSLIPLFFALGLCLGPTYSLLQRLAGDDMRATMMALVMLLSNLIGFGLGPQAVGIISDVLAPAFGIESLRYAMLIMSFLSLWAAFHFWKVASSIELACGVGGRRVR